MLVIRQAQLDTFQRRAEASFVERVTIELGTPPDFARHGIAVARGFRFTTESAITAFLKITWAGFGTIPAFPRPALAILCRHTHDTAGKLQDYSNWVEEALRPPPPDTEALDAEEEEEEEEDV